MKYFTPELIERLGSLDDARADAAAADWESAVTRHEEHLQAIRAQLPPSLCYLWDNFYLHDAEVLSMGRQGQTFVIVLRLEPSPKDLLILNYQLIEEPVIQTEVLPPEDRSRPVEWLHDEMDLVQGERSYATHTILFSNGWEVKLHLRDLQVVVTQTLLPAATTPALPATVPSA